MINKKKLIALVLGILMIGLFIGNATAADEIGANVVTGNAYTCFFFTPLDVFNGQMTFGEKGALTISSFDGYGFYLPVAELFTAGYWALNVTLGTQTGDIVILMAGVSFDPLIAGVGTIIMQYSQVYVMGFTGFKATVQ